MEDGHGPEHRTGLPAEGALVCTSILCWVLGQGVPPSLREDAGRGIVSVGETDSRPLVDTAPPLE